MHDAHPGLQAAFQVQSELDVFDARRAAERIARACGFARTDAGILTLVTSELGYNIIRHAGRGRITLGAFEHPELGGALRVEATDQGPPIANLAVAIKDGHDASGPLDPAQLFERPGIGSGLGAIQRLSHEFRYERAPNGNVFVVVRYRHTPRRRARR